MCMRVLENLPLPFRISFLRAHAAACARTVRADLPGRKGGRGLSCRVPTALDSRPLRCTYRVVTPCAAGNTHTHTTYTYAHRQRKRKPVVYCPKRKPRAFLDSASLGLTLLQWRGLVWSGLAWLRSFATVPKAHYHANTQTENSPSLRTLVSQLLAILSR